VRFQGRKVKILLREPVENRRHWEGVLAGFGEGSLTLEAEGGRTLRFTPATGPEGKSEVRVVIPG
jgi:ribosome maturation factor RimP